MSVLHRGLPVRRSPGWESTFPTALSGNARYVLGPAACGCGYMRGYRRPA
jgi:hypothetical protein